MGQNVIGIDYDSHNIHVAIYDGESLLLVRQNLDKITLYAGMIDLAKLITPYVPRLILIEAPVYVQNPKATYKLTRVCTVCQLACEYPDFPYQIIPNTQWRKAAWGKAIMQKEQVVEKAIEQFGEIITDHHFADAASMALVAWRQINAEQSGTDNSILGVQGKKRSILDG